MVSALKRLRLGATFAGGLDVAKRFPLPAGCALLFAALFIGDQHDLFDSQDERVLSFLALGFFAALAGALFAEQRKWQLALRIMSSALPLGGVAAIVFMSHGRYDDVWAVHFLFLMPGLILLAMAAPFLVRTGANDAFWGFNHDAWFGTALGLASALIVGLAAMALFAAFDILFGIEVDSDFFSDVWVICLAVLWPWVALYAIPRNFDDPEGDFAPVWLRFVAGILLVPIATIYLVVLYAYGISILVSWDLPRGNVANIACGFAAVGVITHLISYPWRDSGSRWLRLFYRTFHVLLFVPIALLAIAVSKRVGDYGVTEERYFLAIAAAWLAVMALYFTLRGRRIVLVPASLAVLLIAASFGSWGATATSERSQVGILHGLLAEAGLIENGHVAPSEGAVDFELRKRISSVLDYLANSGKVEALRPLYANTDVAFVDDTRPSAPDLVAALGFDYVGHWQDSATFSFNGPDRAQIEIAGFDMLVERSLWRGIEDEAVVAEGGQAFTVSYDDAAGVLTVTAEDGETVSFNLADLAETLLSAGHTGATGVATDRMIRTMTLNAAAGPLLVRALVVRLWGSVDAETPTDVAADVILLIGYVSPGE